MGPAAQLARVAHRDDTDLIAILFTEEHLGTGLSGLLDRQDAPTDRLGGLDGLIDLLLDLQQFLRCQGLKIVKVEPQPIGIDHRAGLLSGVPQDGVERSMKQVGGRVIGLSHASKRLIDLGGDRLTGGHLAR